MIVWKVYDAAVATMTATKLKIQLKPTKKSDPKKQIVLYDLSKEFKRTKIESLSCPDKMRQSSQLLSNSEQDLLGEYKSIEQRKA